jgi:flavin reductase (DIM6/NTAB) family NADH-FMN oxidoreductase RutF
MTLNPGSPAAKEKVPFSVDKMLWHPTPLIGQVTLVTTLNEDGASNVAPKSLVSMMILRPPVLALGCNLNHWTSRNLRRSHECVVNLPGVELAGAVWASQDLPHPRTVESAGLTPVPSLQVKPPSIAECRAHLECVYEHEVVYGEEIVVLARVVAATIDKDVLEAQDPYEAMRLFAFLEERLYGVIERSERLPQ